MTSKILILKWWKQEAHFLWHTACPFPVTQNPSPKMHWGGVKYIYPLLSFWTFTANKQGNTEASFLWYTICPFPVTYKLYTLLCRRRAETFNPKCLYKHWSNNGFTLVVLESETIKFYDLIMHILIKIQVQLLTETIKL